MVLKLTFVNGETHVFPFDSTSTLSVTTRTGDQATGVIEQTLTWSEIVGLELVDEHVADAVTEQTLNEQAAAIAAGPTSEPAPADTSPETLATPAAATSQAAEPTVQPVEAAPAADVQPVDETTTTPESTLATPVAAVEHAATLPVPDAAAHIGAALAKFPDDPDLVAAKADLDQQLQA